MAAVRLPPASERKRANGDGFAPRPMIRIVKGAPPKGGRRGENPGGGNRSPPPPRRAKTRIAQRERLQRRARSPREQSERIVRPAYKKRQPREVFHTMEPPAVLPRLRDYGTDPGTFLLSKNRITIAALSVSSSAWRTTPRKSESLLSQLGYR